MPDRMGRLAERPTTYCKFSGMLTEVRPGRTVVALTDRIISRLAAPDVDAFWHGNAERFYGVRMIEH